jgi:hypothetical protein
MTTMKGDMAGAAAVLGAMKSAALLGLPVEIRGYIAACENMISGRAYRVGDVLKTLSGKTVEVMNTDAEGRLTLADALCYAEREGAERILELSTLTGAAMVALGEEVAALFATEEAWGNQVREAARRVGEKVWPMPLERAYREKLKSPVADLKNVGGPERRGHHRRPFPGGVRESAPGPPGHCRARLRQEGPRPGPRGGYGVWGADDPGGGPGPVGKEGKGPGGFPGPSALSGYFWQLGHWPRSSRRNPLQSPARPLRCALHGGRNVQLGEVLQEEVLHLAAGGADQVDVGLVVAIVAGVALGVLELVDEPVLPKDVQVQVDGGKADVIPPLLQAVVELLRRGVDVSSCPGSSGFAPAAGCAAGPPPSAAPGSFPFPWSLA